MNKCIFIFLTLAAMLHAQADSTESKPSRVSLPSYIQHMEYGAATLGAIGGLYLFADEAYYQDKRVPFHWARHYDGSLDWFDNAFRGIDKFGHMFSAGLFADNFYFLALHLGYSKQTASAMAFGSAVTILGAMEIWDAHFEHWGFSPGDFLANLIGAAFSVARHHYPILQGLNYKVSYDFLAAQTANHSVHDYENMEFWLTFNPAKLFTGEQPGWLRYLNLALGFGVNSRTKREPELYVALDYNLEAFPVHTKWLRWLLHNINRYHFPAPAIRISPDYIAYGIFF